MDRFADWRARIGFTRFDRDADQVAGVVANLGENLVRFAALVPIDVNQLDRSDLVLGTLVAAAGLGIYVLDFRHAEYALLDFAYQPVLFFDRQIAAGTDVDVGKRHFDFREIFDAAPEREEHGVDRNQEQSHGANAGPRPCERGFQKLDVTTGEPGDAVEVAGFRSREIAAHLGAGRPGLAEYRTQGRHEYQCHDQRRGQDRNQRDR